MNNVAAELAGEVNQVAIDCSEMAEQQRQDPDGKECTVMCTDSAAIT